VHDPKIPRWQRRLQAVRHNFATVTPSNQPPLVRQPAIWVSADVAMVEEGVAGVVTVVVAVVAAVAVAAVAVAAVAVIAAALQPMLRVRLPSLHSHPCVYRIFLPPLVSLTTSQEMEPRRSYVLFLCSPCLPFCVLGCGGLYFLVA